MSIELRPLGVACNLACQYCYQQPQRDAGNQKASYDLEKMKEAATRIGGAFTLFGGEPLLMPFDDLEHLFAWGFEKFGRNAIQTNGTLIEDRHIDLFRRYKVSVGLSIDGPGALNDVRSHHVASKTRGSTALVEKAIERLCREHQAPGLIATLHKGNATAEMLPIMIDWLRGLHAIGIRNVRLHLLEVDHHSVRDQLALSPRENIEALLAFAKLQANLPGLRVDLFDEMERLLTGDDSGISCVWRACDPYTTEAVQGVEGNGQASNCGRTDKEGIGFIKANKSGCERYLALYRTSQEDHGCGGCRFFLMCKGQCPGTAILGDWRNRTEHCEVWMNLFALMESQAIAAGKVPLTIDPRRIEIERRMVEAWESGRNPSIKRISQQLRHTPVSADRSATHAKAISARPRVRLSWVSERARELWQSRLHRLPIALGEMTAGAVGTQPDLCSVRLVGGRSFHRLIAHAAQHNLGATILPLEALPGGIPMHPEEGTFGVLLTGTPAVVARAEAAWAKRALPTFHALLDLPACCLQKAQSATAEKIPSEYNNDVHLPEQIAIHPLLAALGISVLPIHPCRLDCPSALAWTTRTLQFAAEHSFAEEVDWLRECFSWSISWSDLHGVTEVKTPLFKICYLSKRASPHRVVLRPGRSAVDGSVSGLSFPYFQPVRQGKMVQIEGI